jgi:AraC-like DNA-binding protein
MVRFGRLANDAIAFDLDEDPEEARFTHRVLGVDPDLARPINEFAVATMVLRSTEQASRAIGPRRVWFAHREAADPEAVARFFGVPVSYGRPDNGVAVAIEHLDAPLATADPRLRATAEQLAERALADHPPADDLVARIARRVEVRLGSGTASARRVAADLGMSPRTLQRRLDDHGLTWRALLDRVRVEAARVYLAESPLEVGEIALRLGFAETRAFSRAFRRWTGRSPGEYRRSPS